MSVRSEPPPARLVISAIYREERKYAEALPRVAGAVGAVRPAGDRFPFDLTDYYCDEMGAPLFRRFLTAKAAVPRDALPAVKIALESIEREMADGGRRTVNLDPGLLTAESFILATGKNYTHRVYLGNGVFADLTLVYRKGEFHPLPWTYPDYASGEVRSLLREIRREYLGGAAGAAGTP